MAIAIIGLYALGQRRHLIVIDTEKVSIHLIYAAFHLFQQPLR